MQPIRDALIEHTENMEQAISRLAETDDIWQNKIVLALCRAVLCILQWILSQMRKRQQGVPRVGEFEKVSAIQFLVASADCFGGTAEEFSALYDRIKLPSRSTSGSAGYDIHSPFEFTLEPGHTIKIPSGIRVRIDEGWWLGCLPRSSVGFKYRVALDNTMGVIDSDYYHADNEGHIFIKLTNNGSMPFTVRQGDRIVQAIFLPYGITYSDNAKASRGGGIGSTGA